MKAKVLSVYDEGSLVRTALIGARGISILIDTDGERTLFDTGMRGNYLMHNMDHLNIDVNTIDRVVISHMHRPHIGGLAAFLERRDAAVNVVAPSRIDMRKRVLGIQMGKEEIPDGMSGKMNIGVISEWAQLSDNLFVTGSVPAEAPPAGAAPEAQTEENSLVLMTKKGPVLICGCCHNGISNVMSFIKERTGKKVAAVIGGLHMVKMKRTEVHAVADTFADSGPPELYLNHCTGQTQRTYLREKLGMDAVKEFYAGTEISFDI
ncbi:MAG: MBL fold metallo-hydrolase [Methanomassiliicoccaceae archaeon]|nr:MBL fold metallo-hydrolase [Methanomassiliicoccaceae archaeon]MCL2143656.1 MBL fold metallo-hydrolase [Methanomassiliicoccaceae archaeon]